jgi:hypothetical protein
MTGNRVSKEQVMRHLHTVTMVVLMGVSGLVLATEPAAVKKPAQPVADSSCRNVSNMTGKVQTWCGTSAQWAEFDSRMAKLDKGFSCRPYKGAPPLCLFAKQWEYMSSLNSRQGGNTAAGGLGGSAGFGDAAGQMLSMSVNANGTRPAARYDQ